MTVYYNENDPHAADWLERTMAVGLIPAGDVDRRDVRDVRVDELKGYVQCHFFAGIGGWPLSLRSVGWRDDRPVWTASLPCQPFSQAGKKLGFDDPRHLWPVIDRLVDQCRPAVVFGEQSARATAWLGAVRGRLDQMEYAVGAIPLEAACAGAEHRRERFYIVADRNDEPRRIEQRQRGSQPERAWDEPRWRVVGNDEGDDERGPGLSGRAGESAPGGSGAGDGLDWYTDNKGRSRRAPPGIRMLAHGVSGRVARRRSDGTDETYSRTKALKGFGNALDQRAARTFIASCMDFLVPALWTTALLGIAAAAAMAAWIGHPLPT